MTSTQTFLPNTTRKDTVRDTRSRDWAELIKINAVPIRCGHPTTTSTPRHLRSCSTNAVAPRKMSYEWIENETNDGHPNVSIQHHNRE